MGLKEKLDKIPIPPLKECGVPLNTYERLKTYFVKIACTSCPSNANDSMNLINDTIVEVEDCHSGIEAVSKPGYNNTNGRMYPIQDDNISRKANGQIVAQSKGNKIIIEADGSFTILDRLNDEVIISKSHS